MTQATKARELSLRGRVQTTSWLLVIGLLIAGATAIPIESELDVVARWLNVSDLSPEQASSSFAKWILIVREAVHTTNAKYPFLAYGTDWLAFAHFVLAMAFLGPARHPLRNAWLFTVGMTASMAVLPWALIVGELRHVPLGWRLIDCAFGVAGFVPCWLCARWTREMEKIKRIEATELPG